MNIMELEKAKQAKRILDRLEILEKQRIRRDELREILRRQFEPKSELWDQVHELANMTVTSQQQLEELLEEKLRNL